MEETEKTIIEELRKKVADLEKDVKDQRLETINNLNLQVLCIMNYNLILLKHLFEKLRIEEPDVKYNFEINQKSE